MNRAMCRSLLPRAIALSVTTQARTLEVPQDLEWATAEGRPYSASSQALAGVWNRKPIK
jgi:hypothetical protein